MPLASERSGAGVARSAPPVCRAMSPTLHATLVAAAALVAMAVAFLILARYPHSVASRVHAAYGGTVAWWLLSMALVASAESPERAYFWSRIAQVGVGMLPAVVYHLNLATSGLARGRQRAIRVHYGSRSRSSRAWLLPSRRLCRTRQSLATSREGSSVNFASPGRGSRTTSADFQVSSRIDPVDARSTSLNAPRGSAANGLEEGT